MLTPHRYWQLAILALFLSLVSCAGPGGSVTPTSAPAPPRQVAAQPLADITALLAPGGYPTFVAEPQPGTYRITVKDTLDVPFYNAKIIIIDNPGTRGIKLGEWNLPTTMRPHQTSNVKIKLKPGTQLQASMIQVWAQLD